MFKTHCHNILLICCFDQKQVTIQILSSPLKVESQREVHKKNKISIQLKTNLVLHDDEFNKATTTT